MGINQADVTSLGGAEGVEGFGGGAAEGKLLFKSSDPTDTDTRGARQLGSCQDLPAQSGERDARKIARSRKNEKWSRYESKIACNDASRCTGDTQHLLHALVFVWLAHLSCSFRQDDVDPFFVTPAARPQLLVPRDRSRSPALTRSQWNFLARLQPRARLFILVLVTFCNPNFQTLSAAIVIQPSILPSTDFICLAPTNSSRPLPPATGPSPV